MSRKYVLYYAIFCAAIVVSLIISMFVIKRWEDKGKEQKNIEEKIDEIKEYEAKNKVPKAIRVKLTKTGEVVTMDMDEYLKGVVPSEMPPSYDIEALKAQAIVARTYVYEKMQRKVHKDCDVCDNYACCQAYYSKDKITDIWTSKGFDEKTKKEYWNKVEEAVNSTNNVVITYKGEYIKAYFHANSGGKTEASTEIWGKENLPYLVPVESMGEENHKYYKTEVKLSIEELEEKLNKGSDRKCNIDVSDEDWIKILSYTISGRVKSVKIGNDIYEATALRTTLGLKSTNFTIQKEGENVIFKVTGYGHGLGLSQTGSNYYASNGWTFDKIIKHYYTGVDITKSEES